MVIIPIVSLDELLRAEPSAVPASPAYQAVHWVSDALMALPLGALAIWAGDRLAGRLGLGLAGVSDAFARASMIAGPLALTLVPGWFAHTEIDNLTAPQSLLAAHSSGHAGHSEGGGGVFTHWVSGGVIYALVAAPLAAVAVWGGYQIVNRLRSPGHRRVFARMAVIVLLLAAVAGPAWLLQQAANRAQASQVYYTNALLIARPQPRGFFVHNHQSAVAPAAHGAPFGFAYQGAFALQDGLAAQAIGLPVIFGTLLWWYARHGRTDAGRQIPDEGT